MAATMFCDVQAVQAGPPRRCAQVTATSVAALFSSECRSVGHLEAPRAPRTSAGSLSGNLHG
jgi:hypothetical protein